MSLQTVISYLLTVLLLIALLHGCPQTRQVPQPQATVLASTSHPRQTRIQVKELLPAQILLLCVGIRQGRGYQGFISSLVNLWDPLVSCWSALLSFGSLHRVRHHLQQTRDRVDALANGVSAAQPGGEGRPLDGESNSSQRGRHLLTTQLVVPIVVF